MTVNGTRLMFQEFQLLPVIGTCFLAQSKKTLGTHPDCTGVGNSLEPFLFFFFAHGGEISHLFFKPSFAKHLVQHRAFTMKSEMRQ